MTKTLMAFTSHGAAGKDGRGTEAEAVDLSKSSCGDSARFEGVTPAEMRAARGKGETTHAFVTRPEPRAARMRNPTKPAAKGGTPKPQDKGKRKAEEPEPVAHERPERFIDLVEVLLDEAIRTQLGGASA